MSIVSSICHSWPLPQYCMFSVAPPEASRHDSSLYARGPYGLRPSSCLYSAECVQKKFSKVRLATSASLRALLERIRVGLGDAGVYLADFHGLRLRRPPCSFQIFLKLLKLSVVHHLLRVFSGLPHIDYHHSIVGPLRTGVRYALRPLVGNGMLKLSIVGRRRQGARPGLLAT